MLYDWAYRGKRLYGAFEPLNSAQRMSCCHILETAASDGFPSYSICHVISACKIRMNYKQQPHFMYVWCSRNTAYNLLLGVTFFSTSPEMGDRKQIAVMHVLIVSVRASHRFPLQHHNINFPNSFKAVMYLSTSCQSCSVCKKCYKWLYFQKNILLLISVLNTKRS